MLEVIKEVLISSKRQELSKREEINNRINEIKREEQDPYFQAIDEELVRIEKKIDSLNSSFFKRLFNGKKINELYEKYSSLSRSKLDKINSFNSEREELLEKLYELSHDEVLIEKEIEKIKKAHSVDDLGLTQEEALGILKGHFHDSDSNIIKAVFSNIKNNRFIETREDIFKCMQEIYQTNASSFVLAMKNILPRDFVSYLLEIGITVDEDKVSFLNSLTSYILEPTSGLTAIMKNLDRTDRLDVYYYNEMEKALSNMERYASRPNAQLSYIMSLSALVSMAKANKLESKKQNK